jgi:hypothetical protein
LKLLVKARQVGGLPNIEPLGLPVPTVNLLHRRFLEVFSAYIELAPLVKVGTVPRNALSCMDALNNDYPDAGLLLLTAVARLRMAVDPLNRGDVPGAREHLQAVADLSSRATKAPTLVPRSPVRYFARGLGVLADVAVLKLIRQPDAVHLQRLRDNQHPLVAEGENWPKLREPMISFFIQLVTVPLTQDQCVDWNLDDPAGKELFSKRRRHLAVLGNILLDDWAINEPGNAVIPRLRQSLTKWRDSSGLVKCK